MVLQGDRILLRKFRKEDAEEYFEIANEISIKKYLPYSSPDDLEECAELIENYSDLDFINDFYFAIEDKKTHQLLGALLAFRTLTFTLDISYFIAKDFRGNGFILEALNVFINYLSENTVYNTLFFMINNKNKASLKIMKKLDSKKIQTFPTTSSFEYQIKSAN